MQARIEAFLELAVKQGGSDLHMVSGNVPRIRIHGMQHALRFRELSVDEIERILMEFMTQDQARRLDEFGTVDFSYAVPGLGRFRVNAYRHVSGIAAAMRVIPTEIQALEKLGLPASVKLQSMQPKGLTLVTGPTGSGKSTTLAAIVDQINCVRKGHIITLEDPIEFLHPFKNCVISQREIGTHTPSFSGALRDAVREDPDVILVGELRDLESMSLALSAAETGIQVLGTLHTSGACRTVDRFINVFAAKRQDQVRAMLADSLRLIVSQRLVRTVEGNQRLVVADVLINTPAASAMIRAGNSHKLESVIQAGGSAGMQSLDAKLRELVMQGAVSLEDAMANALDPGQFEHALARRAA